MKKNINKLSLIDKTDDHILSKKHLPIQENLDITQLLIIWVLIAAAYTAFFHIWDPINTCFMISINIATKFTTIFVNKSNDNKINFNINTILYTILIIILFCICENILLEFTSFFQAILKRFVTQ